MSAVDRLARLEAHITKSVAGVLSDFRITGTNRQKDREMTDPNDSASPQIKTEWPNSNFHNTHSTGGLTKREMFAMAAMQGYCAVEAGWNQPPEEVARCAAVIADALIAELNKETP